MSHQSLLRPDVLLKRLLKIATAMVLTFSHFWLGTRNKHDSEAHSEAAPKKMHGLLDGSEIRPALNRAYRRTTGIHSEIDAARNQLFTHKPCSCCRPEGRGKTQVRVNQAQKHLRAIKLNLEDIKKETMLLSTLFADPADGYVEQCIRCLKETPQSQPFFAPDINSAKGQPPSSSGTAEPASWRPPNSFRLYGRSLLVWEIAQQLCSGDTTQSRVAILGTAGMGKTAVAVKVLNSEVVVRTFKPEHRFWVPCKGVTSTNALLQILKVSIQTRSSTGYSWAPLASADIIGELKTPNHPRLVILDNFESPWLNAKCEERKGIQRVLYALSDLPHVAILITMQSHVVPSGPSQEKQISWQLHHLSPLGPEACRMMYTEICPVSGYDKPALDDLLKALDHMPCIVKAMAEYGKAFGYSPPSLLADWKVRGAQMLSGYEIERYIV